MAKTRSDISKWLFTLLFVVSIKCSVVNSEPEKSYLDLFDLERFGHVILSSFSKNGLAKQDLSSDDEKCAKEIEAIVDGFNMTKPQLWAIKLVDSWGKIPSGFLEGNMFELGGFSECFHIERDQKLYETKYCMPRLLVNMTQQPGMPSPKSFHNPLNDLFIMDDLDSNFEDESGITPRMTGDKPDTGISLTIGICVPTVCSMEFLAKNIKIPDAYNKMLSLQFNEKTCQLEENVTGLRTIDWVTIGILATVLFCIVISTGYDIFCTLCDWDKSQALLAFSFYTNGIKLLSYKKSNSPDMMHCLNGIRAISTQWVVMGHTFIMYTALPMANKAVIPQFISKYHNMVIMSALVSVDTFFVLSGLLVCYNMLKALEKSKGRINIPMLYFHRYLRLTPFLAISVLFSMSLLRYFGNGPLWLSTIDGLSKTCEKHWWPTLLYIQNYYNPKEICFGHSWYLSVDMQLFFFSPFVVYLIHLFGLKAILGMALLVLGCIACTVAVHVEKGYTIFFTKFATAYIPTHLRYSPWLIGVILGYFLFKTRNKTIRIPTFFNLYAWAASLTTMVLVILLNHPLVQMNQGLNTKHTPFQFGLYDGLSRAAWGISVSYVIFACVHGKGGIVNAFLGHPLWQPVSRICYSIYLIHFPIILVVMVTLKTPLYFTELGAFHTFIGNYVLTFFISIIATLAFDSPLVVVEKLLFSPRKKPQPPKPSTSNGGYKSDSEAKPNETQEVS